MRAGSSQEGQRSVKQWVLRKTRWSIILNAIRRARSVFSLYMTEKKLSIKSVSKETFPSCHGFEVIAK